MELIKRPCTKEKYKDYFDFVLRFEKDGEQHEVLIRPCFWNNVPLLSDVAKLDVKK